MANRVKVDVKKGEEDLVLYIQRPDRNVFQKAQRASNRIFRESLNSGAMLKSELDPYLRERGIWDDEKEEKLNVLDKAIDDNLLKLKKGGIKKSEGKDIALEIRRQRLERTIMVAQRDQLDDFTVEAQCQNEFFDCLVSECTFNEEGERYFSGLDDYKAQAHEDYVAKVAAALSSLLYGIKENWRAELPENKFLKEYGFINDNLQLVNSDGQLIDTDGKLINEDFEYVNEEGRLVDEKGNVLDDDGLPAVESQPFLDDE